MVKLKLWYFRCILPKKNILKRKTKYNICFLSFLFQFFICFFYCIFPCNSRATAQANALRKDLIKKPPIMSIVRQKSPVVTSLLPSTKEQSLWLFDKLDGEVLRHKNATETLDDVIFGKSKTVLKSYPVEQKVFNSFE